MTEIIIPTAGGIWRVKAHQWKEESSVRRVVNVLRLGKE